MRTSGRARVGSRLISSYRKLTLSRAVDFRKRSHETWGRLYKVKEVKVEWHVSTQGEIDFAVELLRDIVVPTMDKLDALLAEAKEDNKILSLQWVNDFCRVSFPLCPSREMS